LILDSIYGIYALRLVARGATHFALFQKIPFSATDVKNSNVLPFLTTSDVFLAQKMKKVKILSIQFF